MGPNKERVVMKDLRAGRLIVSIVETYQSVAKKGSQLAERLRQLSGRSGRFDDTGQVCAHLQFRVTVVVNPRGPLISFTGAENRLRHFKIPEFSSKRKQCIGLLLDVRDLM